MEAVTSGGGIDIRLRRSNEGIELSVRADSSVEDFFKRWGGGEKYAPDRQRLWRSKSGAPLQVWSYFDKDDIPAGLGGMLFTLNNAGGELVDQNNGRVNLSFLRLVGVSEGITINLDMVLSKSELRKIAERILHASEQFYNENIRPVNMEILVSVKERVG